MAIDAKVLASVISRETSLEFVSNTRKDGDGHQVISLMPAGHNSTETFSIELTIQWRRLHLRLIPGTFAGPLLGAMFEADASGRANFIAVLNECEGHGAKINIDLNGTECRFDSDALWRDPWKRFLFSMATGNIELGTDSDFEEVLEWVMRFTSALVSLLPLEAEGVGEMHGYPEGAIQKIEVNRYERDRRNRAAALAIHGFECSACGLDFGKRYGSEFEGYIHVHHVVPVSKVGPHYVINPKDDLIPLCPNCHAVAHRRNPPFTIAEIQEKIASNNS